MSDPNPNPNPNPDPETKDEKNEQIKKGLFIGGGIALGICIISAILHIFSKINLPNNLIKVLTGVFIIGLILLCVAAYMSSRN